MRKIIQWVNTPLVALPVMVRAHNAVDRRVAQIEVGRRHIDFGAQGAAAIRELPVFHALEQIEVFLRRAAAVRAFAARLCQRATVFAHFIGRQIADIGLAVADELDRIFIALVKVIGAVKDRVRICAEPAQILLDRLDELRVLLDGIRVVVAQVEQPVIFLCDKIIDEDRLCAADMQIAVRLRREARVNPLLQTVFNILIDNIR